MRYLEAEESRLSLPAGCGRGGGLGDTYMEVVGRAFTVPVCSIARIVVAYAVARLSGNDEDAAGRHVAFFPRRIGGVGATG